MRRIAPILILAAACGPSTRPGDATPPPAQDAGVTGTRDAGPARPPPLCDDGAELFSASLVPIAPVPALDDVPLTGLPSGSHVGVAGDGDRYSLRIQGCATPSGPGALSSILYLGESFETPTLYVLDDTVTEPVSEIVEVDVGVVVRYRMPPSRVLVTGWGSETELTIHVVHEQGLVIRSTAAMVAVAEADVTPTSATFTKGLVVVGRWEIGDVFDRDCKLGERERSATFALDTAAFEIGYCAFQAAGHTEGHRFVKVTVTDSNPALLEAERAPFTFEGEEEIEAVMDYRWNHHNACDSFHLALPHADYAASSAPSAGCGQTVPNAPERSWDENPRRPVLFRLRYHGDPWQDGSVPDCYHYLTCP